MLYNIKYNANKQYGEVEPNRCAPIFTIGFTIAELNYSDSVSLEVEGFTKAKAKALIKAKVKAHLAEQPEVEEYTEEISVINTK